MDHSNGAGVPSSELHDQIEESSGAVSAVPSPTRAGQPEASLTSLVPDGIPTPSPEPPIVESSPPPSPAPHQIPHGHKFIYGYLAVLALVAAAGIYSWHNVKHISLPAARTTPANTTVNVDGIAITYVNMPDLASSNAGNMSGPELANGHYLYIITSPLPKCNGSAQCPVSDSGTLVYDGHHIYTGSLDTTNFALSSNGLHYEYSNNDTGAKAVLTTDKTKITTQNTLEAPGTGTLSDDGLAYAYITDTVPPGTGTTNIWSIYRNNNRLSTITDASASSSADVFTFSGDLTHYIGSLEDQNTADETGTSPAFGDTQPAIILDGKKIATLGAAGSQDADSSISNNGQHYIYSWDGSVVVDGKTISPVNSSVTVINDSITDDGVYSYTACAEDQNSGVLHLNTKTFPVGACSPTNSAPSIYTNFDGDHYFYWNGVAPGTSSAASNQGVLDGKPYALSGHVAGVQFVDNTLYVYRWANN